MKGTAIEMAEREGFEPSIEFPLYTLSRRAPSTTRPSLQGCSYQSSKPRVLRSFQDRVDVIGDGFSWRGDVEIQSQLIFAGLLVSQAVTFVYEAHGVTGGFYIVFDDVVFVVEINTFRLFEAGSR